ncbi:hypothetical protein [Roseibium sp. MMSF_3412]|uniref:hypothetical protein n=1 Tax=Roseibium sp. MMSF_3412 TaxID=3046712 RepID=UPI00273D3CD8|nr:hypothetical protein [Roseibium sp. MMSF_3412]
MADDPCWGWWDLHWNKEFCTVLSEAKILSGEFTGAAYKLRVMADLTDDVYAKRKLFEAAERFDLAGKALGTPEKFNDAFKAFHALKTFHENFKKLTPQLIANDPDASAKAFGDMLAAAATAFDKMGMPFILYTKFLTDAGELIDGVLHGLMPDKRKGVAWSMYRKAMNDELRGDKHLIGR